MWALVINIICNFKYKLNTLFIDSLVQCCWDTQVGLSTKSEEEEEKVIKWGAAFLHTVKYCKNMALL